MDFQGLELNSREAARRPLPFDILKRATRCRAKKQKTVTHMKIDHIYIPSYVLDIYADLIRFVY